MPTIAIITDIHGNLPAFKAVLKDIHNQDIHSKIYCLGDLEDGAPWHNEVIDLIRELEIPTIVGNHDERIINNEAIVPLEKLTEEEQQARFATIKYSMDTITDENREFMANMPENIRFEHSGVSCLLVHGSPNHNNEYVFENHDNDLIKEFFLQTNSDVIVCGHTHIPYIRKFSKDGKHQFYINAGSVGRPKKSGGKATYLSLTINESGEISPEIRYVEYNMQEAVEGIKASGVPDFYAKNLLHRAQEE